MFNVLQRKHWRMEAPLDMRGSPLAFQQPPFIQVHLFCSYWLGL